MPVDLLAHRLVWIREASADSRISGPEPLEGLGSPSEDVAFALPLAPIDWAGLRVDAMGRIQRMLRPLSRLWSREAQ